MTSRSLLLAATAIGVSGALSYISTGLHPFAPATWIAPLPVLLFAYAQAGSRRAAGLAAACAYVLGGLNMLPVLVKVVPPPVIAILLLVPAVGFALAVLAGRSSARSLPAWAAAAGLPLAWTTFEFLLSLVSPHGTVASLAYTQTDFLPLLQIASVTGIWGITFLLMLVPSAIAAAWTRRSLAPLGLAAGLAALAIGFGAWRLGQPSAAPAVRVGLAAADDAAMGAAFATEDRATAVSVAKAYGERIRRLAAEGAQVVVIPEKVVGVTPDSEAEVRQALGDAARAARVTVVAGLNGIARQPPRNLAVVFGPDGGLQAQYDKRHLLPGPETGYAVGERVGTFAAPGGAWGTAICKDLDFQGWSREYGRSGVRLLAVPAWDFVDDARFHSRMAVVRGVENGFAIARTAAQGRLTLSDAQGRVLAEAATEPARETLLTGDLRPGPGRTVYTRAGDWFAWTSVAGMALLVGRRATARRSAA